jgi:hypothetical protein
MLPMRGTKPSHAITTYFVIGANRSIVNRILKQSLFSPAQSRRLFHPPALSLPRQTLCPGRIFPQAAFSHHSDLQRTE